MSRLWSPVSPPAILTYTSTCGKLIVETIHYLYYNMPSHHNDDNQTASQRQKLAKDYLPKALERIVHLISNAHSERVQLDASIWVAEMAMGKPKQELQTDPNNTALALELAKALRVAIEGPNRSDILQEGVILDGNVRVLGALSSGEDNEFPEEP